MDRLRYAALVVVIAILSATVTRGQDSIRVTLFRPPPNQLKVADLWRVRIENRTSNTLTVYLFGQADEARDGKIVDATCSRFLLPPGIKLVSGAEIQPIDANYYNQRYKDVFLRTGQAPTGDYRVCVTVRNAATDADLATDCYDQRIEVTTPPILVMPRDESIVEDKLPTFTWLPPTPVARGSRPTYLLRIVEILGRQTPYDAMQSNPAWFDRSPVSSTVFPYPIASRPFKSGVRYAWQVTASEQSFPLGESEIWWFTYQPPATQGGGGRRPIVDIGGGIGTDRGSLDSTGGGFHFVDRGVQIIDIGDVSDSTAPYVYYRIPGAEIFKVIDLTVPPSVLDALLTPCLGNDPSRVFRKAP